MKKHSSSYTSYEVITQKEDEDLLIPIPPFLICTYLLKHVIVHLNSRSNNKFGAILRIRMGRPGVRCLAESYLIFIQFT